MSNLDINKSSAKRILIVDDDSAILEAMQMMLEMEGYEVMITLNGEELDKYFDKKPDVILLDIWMSGIDGRDICKNLKAAPATRNIPVIMISASREVEQSAKESGADDFIAKPFQMNELLSVISAHIK
jgi:DNA-binding response OmpR family regulator